jgi:site-specific DNA-methyltransferase (adenine-specific)
MKNRGQNGSLNYAKVARTKEKKVGNVFFYSIGGGISTKDKIAYKHPAIYPEKLVIDQIKSWTNENDIVYDPFLGSGTTAKIAALLNRQWLGSEISKEYVSIAQERINKHLTKNSNVGKA